MENVSNDVPNEDLSCWDCSTACFCKKIKNGNNFKKNTIFSVLDAFMAYAAKMATVRSKMYKTNLVEHKHTLILSSGSNKFIFLRCL